MHIQIKPADIKHEHWKSNVLRMHPTNLAQFSFLQIEMADMWIPADE